MQCVLSRRGQGHWWGLCPKFWSGYIIVAPTPYYAETDESGNFKIAGIPDGNYTVTAWHEGYKNQSKPVTVAGGAATADFTLTK